MLRRLTLYRFQNHTRTTITFDPQVTTIIGSNGRGKSSILRALRWVMTNKPSGDGFIQKGSDHTKVVLDLDDHRIVRKKGPGCNEYRLDGKVYKAFAAKVPDPIAEIVNVDLINFQTQHAPLFWFGLSAGQVAKELNAVVNLDLIDQSLANLNVELRKTKLSVELTRDRVKSLKVRRKELAGVKTADHELTQLEQLYQSIEDRKARINHWTGIRDQWQTHVLHAKTASRRQSECSRLVQVGKALESRLERYERLESLCRKIQQEQERLEQVEEALAKTTKQINKLTKGKCPTCGKELQ